MNDQSHETMKPIELLIETSTECITAIHQRHLLLNSNIVVKNNSLKFDKLTISIKFDSLGLKPLKWELNHEQLGVKSSKHIEFPPIERTDGKEFTISSVQLIEVRASIIEGEEEIAVVTKTIKLLPPVQISADIASVYSIVFQQNQFPLISRLDLINDSPYSLGLIKVIAEFDPPDFEVKTWMIDELASGQSVCLKERLLKLSATALDGLTEKRLIQFKLSAYAEDFLVSTVTKEIELLPKNHWGGELHMPELLAAFVTPNARYCDSLLKKASTLLAKSGYDSKLDGYQSNTRERPYMIAAALWSAVCKEGLSYCVPPASFAKTGQKIRLSSDIFKSKLATCLDTALLFSSCLEQAGLNTVIALTKNHAMVGVWLIDECFPLLTNDDPVDLRNRIALKDLILFETTLAASDQPIKFKQAIHEADRKITERVENEFVYVVDIKQARSRKISPIDFFKEDVTIQVESSEKDEVELPPPPVLPSVIQQTAADQDLSPADRVDQWRRKLLDLSKRNKLLNIRQRSMGFRIICPDLDLLEDELASGKKYNIISKEALSTKGRSKEQFTLQTGDDLEDELVRDQLKRGSLVAESTERDLEKNLINLFRRAKSDFEEGGANTLFLVIGMLRWKEDSRNEQSYKAPLILLPVKLERTSARSKPRIMQLPDEEPVFNLTLIEMLFQDFEIDLSAFQKELPKDASGIDVKGIWEAVRAKIKGTPGFEVVEELVLSNFTFAKYLMWKDLSDRIDDLKTSPFVNHLVENPTEPYPYRAEFIDAIDIDEKINPENFYAPLNADSSQIIAIEASTKGKDFVLEGPPGTGKSETIANIIAHNIAIGRKVLFVSEKMAALDVVYSRLKRVGLGHLCLELHSNKASKKNVVEQINESWQARQEASLEAWKKKALDLKSLRRALNVYVKELHRKSSLGFSVREAIARSVNEDSVALLNLGWPMDLGTALIQNESDVLKAKECAKNLGLAFKDIAGINYDTFSFIDVSEWSNIWQAKLIDAAHDLKNKLLLFDRKYDTFTDSLGVERPTDWDFESTGCWMEVARVCKVSVDQSHCFALDEDAKVLLGNLDHMAELKEKYDQLFSSAGLTVSMDKVCELPVQKWMSSTKPNCSLQEHFFSGRRVLSELTEHGFTMRKDLYDAKPQIKELMSQNECKLSPEAVAELPISDWINIRDNVANKNVFAKFAAKRKIKKQMHRLGLRKIKDFDELNAYDQLLNTIVEAQEDELNRILSNSRDMVELALELKKNFATYKDDGILDQCSVTAEKINLRKEYGVQVRRNFHAVAGQLQEPASFMKSVRKKLIDEREFLEDSTLVKSAEAFENTYHKAAESIVAFRGLAGETDIAYMTFSSFQNLLDEIIASAPSLNAWCHWVNAKRLAEQYGLDALVRGLETGLINWGETEESTEAAICSWLAPLLIDASDVLRNFSASKHDDLVEQFRKLDEDVANTTGKFIAAKLAAGMPDTTGPNAPHEYGVLSREVQRQRGHKPVRQLVHELGSCLLDLTPCFMMSPLSVAQFLPSDYQAFDLVVFDEASQITVWDAVGAIARGKNVIVVGDPKQMPPTNFFNRAQDMDDSDEADLESILDQAMGASVAYHRLTGHYRSRHESLIAFSNHQYYQNSLATYPCADTRDTAVVWHRIDGLYSRGSSRNNPIEARAVVAEVVRRLKDPELQKMSIGIVTLNSEQQQLIENLLDDERRKDYSLERFFKEDYSEPVFVKNLETVQGDQRDIICLSVGYGPTEPGALTMSMNFGPLNRQGGERRLNVAITRASTEMLVFTSFDPSMIDLSRTPSMAVKDLKAYIDYAARGPVSLAQRTHFTNDADQFDSDFEQSVATRLREKGWQLRTQIGVSKFRIDLGVLDPDAGGSFLAGIECDGASYHSSPSARDRDRVRHIILQNLGWQLIRIWSTDYFINPEKVIDRVHHHLETLLQNKREEKKFSLKEQVVAEETIPYIPSENTIDDVFFEETTESCNRKDTDSEETIEKVGEFCSASTAPLRRPEMGEYTLYSGGPTQDPRNADMREVIRGLIDIIEVEGPMLAKRTYDIYLRCCDIKKMGKDLKQRMNRALQHAIDEKRVIKEDEWGLGGLLYTIIRLPKQHSPQLRELGNRTIEQIPPSEIVEASKLVQYRNNDVVPGSEEHLRLILDLYGLKRLTENTREKLLQAIDFEVNL